MPKKRIFLDECNGDPNLRRVFAPKDHVFTAEDFGIRGKKDPKVIDAAVKEKCTIVTVNKDFVDYYRSHPMRKGKWGKYGYGLIFLKPSKQLTREEQLGEEFVLWSGKILATMMIWFGFRRKAKPD